ncbi:MAG: polar amino acid transport system substrate-binding protein [Frankiales bacterium]|jgi:polar amino acid transport system substrate-binding protein|nr:polar amino acid transport system substrate-binding protein [Frankiales bacterium]
MRAITTRDLEVLTVRARLLSSLPLLAVLPLVLTSCGGSSDSPTVSGPSSSAAPLASLVPAAIKAKGKLVVGSDVSYAPVEFADTDGKTAIGIDPDLAKAIGDKLGITLEFVNGTFDGLIPQLTTSKRIDVIMSAMSDNKKRQATVDFVDYFSAGTSIIVKKGNPSNINTLDDFCGKTVAIQRGTTQDDVATAQQAKCKTAGKPLTVLKFDTDPQALLQIKSGRAVADMNDFPVAAYTAQKQAADFQVVGQQLEAGPYGIGLRKTDTQLRDAIKAAVQAIIDDGTYKTILEKWHVQQGALTTATVNAGT